MLSTVRRVYKHIRDNVIPETFAKIMQYVSSDIEVEPTRQLLQGDSFIHKTTSTHEKARIDINANGLWGFRFSRYFFDVTIFNPLTKSCPKDSVEAYKYHESLNCRWRISTEQELRRCTLVFLHGRAGPFVTVIIKQLACNITKQKNESYSDAMTYIRKRINLLFCAALSNVSEGVVVPNGRLTLLVLAVP